MDSMSSALSPRKLRSDLYSFPCHGQTVTSPPLVISVLASILERHIARNERVVANDGGGGGGSVALDKDARISAFDSHTVLDMSIQAFLERFFRYAHVAPPVYVVAYVYLDRLWQSNAGLRVLATNVQRLLTTAILVASKFVEDMNYRNSYYAKVGGLGTEELNNLELDFLFVMRFKLNVSLSVFDSYCRHLEREVSYGGGYQIERCLRAAFMCGREMASRERQGRQFNKLARVL